MECKDSRPLIGAWVDGEITGEPAAQMAGHLQDCPSCAKEAAFGRDLGRLIAEMPIPSTPPSLKRNTMAAFRAEKDPGTMAEWWRGMSLSMRGAACGFALAGLLAGVVLGGSLDRVLPSASPDSYLKTLYQTQEVLP